jgi:hypothetical protein
MKPLISIGRVLRETRAERLCVFASASVFDAPPLLITPCRNIDNGSLIGKCVFSTTTKNLNAPAGRLIDAVPGGGVCTES